MVRFDLAHPTLRLGLVLAESVRFEPSSEALVQELEAAEARVRADVSAFPEAVRATMRDVLRVGGYKPTGRGKPASELLLAMAQKEGLPRIGNLVEINNLTSLESAFPISIFDLELLGSDPRVRFGRADESYVFNHAGHAMELEGLPVMCRASGEPAGNAVRDSMQTKVNASTQRVLVVLWGARSLITELSAASERVASLLHTHASAPGVEVEFAMPP
ncbi:MAG TPA: phenylalanine--tRNA ligase beta subunit-related protein [Polyangiales bacterium]|nr:phenylalanine--tRNA ligase beta subunit-related protein [Polyangiales bacterium]